MAQLPRHSDPSLNASEVVGLLNGQPVPSKQQAGGSVGLVGSTANLANAAIGAGVLAFPLAYKEAGLILGPLLTVRPRRRVEGAIKEHGAHPFTSGRLGWIRSGARIRLARDRHRGRCCARTHWRGRQLPGGSSHPAAPTPAPRGRGRSCCRLCAAG
jgi:hypothetical protein